MPNRPWMLGDYIVMPCPILVYHSSTTHLLAADFGILGHVTTLFTIKHLPDRPC